MKKAIQIIVKGRVQGVGFRYFTQNTASLIGIYGYVKNRYDGSVEIYAIGTEEQLKILIDKVSKGPSFSHVDEIEKKEVMINPDYKSFTIK